MNFLFFINLITEFLPISSTGHIYFFQNIFNLNNISGNYYFMSHFPALIICPLFFIKYYINRFSKFSLKYIFYEFFLLIISTSIPAITIYLGIVIPKFFFDFDVKFFFNIKTIQSILFIGFFITSTILFLIKYFLNKNKDNKKEKLGFYDSITLGVFQTFAIFPGISRLGITIFTGTILNLEKKYTLFIATILGSALQLGGICLGLFDNFIKNNNFFENIFYKDLILIFFSIIAAVIMYIFFLKKYNEEKLYIFAIYEILISIFAYAKLYI